MAGNIKLLSKRQGRLDYFKLSFNLTNKFMFLILHIKSIVEILFHFAGSVILLNTLFC